MTVLPLTVAPQPYDAWPGYLARVASTLHCRTEDLGAHLGLRTTGRWPAHHGVTLDPNRTQHAARALGLRPSDVTAMHLQRWDGTALDIQDITGAGPRSWPIVPLSWTRLTRPRPCAPCQAVVGHEDLHQYLGSPTAPTTEHRPLTPREARSLLPCACTNCSRWQVRRALLANPSQPRSYSAAGWKPPYSSQPPKRARIGAPHPQRKKPNTGSEKRPR